MFRHQIPIKEQKDINNADVMPRPILPSKEREIVRFIVSC